MSKKTKSVKAVETAMQLMKQGATDQHIAQQLVETNNGLITEGQAKDIVDEAQSILTQEHETKLHDIVLLHKTRYDKEISRLLATEELDESEIGKTITYEQWSASRNKKINAYMKAMDTMKLKENILQMHNEPMMTVDLNEQVDINLDDTKPKFNVSKLTFEEQVELLQLIEKSKKTGNELQSVKEAVFSPVGTIEDITHEIVEVPNIDQIKHEEAPSTPITLATPFDPTALLRKRLKEAAAKEFEKAGAKLSDEEKQHLKN